LENSDDWSAIETILQNFEQAGHKFSIVIERVVIITTRPLTMHDINDSEDFKDHIFLELHNAIKHCQGQDPKFYPHDLLQQLSSYEIIQGVLQNETWLNEKSEESRHQLVKDIHDRAPLLFVLLVGKRVKLGELERALKNKLDDRILQQESIDLSWIENKVQRAIWEDALEHRWSFSAARFMTPGEHQHFHSHTILPWLSMEECGRGAYSTVYAVVVLASHQRLISGTKVCILA
jgi:hypothetical protein